MAAPSTSTPPVVAVVVSHNPGAWFRETLEHLAASRYPALAVLVVDAASDEDPTPLVHEVLPSAAVHRLESNPGYGAAANKGPELVSGAAFYLFLHDDVALDPDAITRLVEESYRSNAGIAGPKLLDWNEPGRIRSVGNAIDKAGVFAPYAEPGELDQEQHDRVRDVFSIQGGCMLVRADLFETLGGFDEGIDFLGDDLDLCWRAHVVGARVLVAPMATARHLEAMAHRGMADERRKRLARHRLRTLSKCYGWVDLLAVLPQAFTIAVAESLFALLTGRFRQARDVMGAWVWNFTRSGAILSARRRLKRLRRVRDRDVRRLQVRGSARLTAFLRGQIGEGSRIQDFTERGRELAGTLKDGPRRLAIAVYAVLAVFFLFGARHLVTRGLPQVGQFLDFPERGVLLTTFSSGWSEVELGATGAAASGVGLLGLAATAMLGFEGLLRQILILGLIPLGWAGVARLTGPLGSRRARLAASVVYAAVPLAYDAIGQARWDVLLLYGTLPFIVLRLARLVGVAPYGDKNGEPGPGIPARSPLHQMVALGLLLAVVSAFEPFVIVMVPALAAVVVVASGLTGNLWRPVRAVVLSMGSAAIAVGLNLPYLLRFTDDLDALWAHVVGDQRGGPAELTDLLRFDVGRFGDSPLLWGLLVAAALCLVIGREWRAAWAPRAWAVAFAGFGAAWIGANDVLAFDVPDAMILLTPAAVGVAWAAAIGFAAFENDVPRFGSTGRSLAIFVGVGSIIIGVLPALGAANDGDYGYPDTSISGALRFIDADPAQGSFRVMWLGDPALLPVPGRDVSGSLAVTVSADGLPDVRAAWPGPPTEASRELVDIVEVGIEGDTARLGRLLTPFGVRYVVVPQALAPSFADAEITPADPAVLSTLASQLDLRRIATDPSVVVYENVSWRPVRALVDDLDEEVLETDDVRTIAAARVGDATPVLTTRESATKWSGTVLGGTVIVAVAEPDDWRLEVDGTRVPSRTAYGWAAAYDVGVAGSGELVFSGGSSRWWLLVQWLAWVVVARIAFAEVRIRREESDDMGSDDEGAPAVDEPAEVGS